MIENGKKKRGDTRSRDAKTAKCFLGEMFRKYLTIKKSLYIVGEESIHEVLDGQITKPEYAS